MDAVFQTNFSTLDWIIAIIYLGGTVGMGIWVNRFVGSLADFLVAGRSLRIYLAIATMTGTEIGLVTVMYNAQEGFERGLSAYVIGVCWFIGLLIVGLTGFIIYRLRELEVMTIPEYYERRYGRKSRVIGGAILALAGILNMGLFLQAGARFMTSVLGIGTGTGLKLLMTAMLALVLLYTTLGGMVSVVITDYIQFVILGGSMVVATIWAITHLGWGEIVNAVVTHRGAAGINPVASDGYGWSYILWMIYMGVAAGSLWATATARALSAQSPKVAKQLYAWSSLTFLSRVVLPVTWGAAALAYISHHPALAQAFLGEGGEKLSGQYAMPVFFAHFFPSGFLGLIAAGMMAGFMSTHDSYLLCWASVITQDVIAPLYRVSERGRKAASLFAGIVGGVATAALIYGILHAAGQPGWADFLVSTLAGATAAAWLAQRLPKVFEAEELSERGRVMITRVLIVLIGLFLLVWGLWYEAPSTLWTYMAVTGTIYLSGAFVCIAFGIYWKRANETGALIALLMGLVAVLGILPWKKWGVEWMTETNIAVVTIILAAVGMVVGSLVTGGGRAAPAQPAEAKEGT